ncbi:hypothetical protein SELMODRAFT_119759 [Selaginella moellendorffii]|uniref:tryptophan synthase n=1 Tax=Selaginella moellendorffii TaxID=88036 RepID=D8SLL8_SELML|nr:hypothetical protein SELMODRAFT_119759 [Selaginella moellendorffii]
MLAEKPHCCVSLQRALMPYLTAGCPSLDTTADALRLLAAGGADVIELGIPCSNPFADGPIIRNSVTKSMENGTNLDSVLSMVCEVAPTLSSPLVLLTYFETISECGAQRFFRDIKAADVSGLIVPDLPAEETRAFALLAADYDIELVLLATPTSSRRRLQEIAALSRGFIYQVSSTGQTGPRPTVNGQVELLLKELKELTDIPIAVGFGISRPEHATQIAKWGANGVIIGSALVKTLGDRSSPRPRLEGLARAGDLIAEFRQALDQQSLIQPLPEKNNMLSI